MLFWKMGLSIKNALAVVLACILCCFCLYFKGSDLGAIEGERTFYLHSASAWAEQKSSLCIFELPLVQGESVECFIASGEKFLEKTLEKYAAQVCFTECVNEILSYYCYSAKLGEGIVLNGVAVNLHVAIQGGRAVVGTPIIFGGF